MKRLLSFFLILSLLLSAVSLSSAEDQEPETLISGDWEYTVKEDGTVVITECYVSDPEVVIPEQFEGKIVTGIGKDAFISCESMKSVTIPDSVTNIEFNPFLYCSSLTEINVSPDHPYLATIDGVLFSKPDKRLVCYPVAYPSEAYEMPKGIITIGNFAFFECKSLTSITISDSVTNIGASAFSACLSLTSVAIPDSVTNIGEWAFNSCSSLTSVTIPDSVTNIGNSAFSGCKSLTSVTIPDSVTNIGEWAFGSCSSLTSITIPDSVTNIGDHAFSFCSSLISITIPDSVTSIGINPFLYCNSLTEIIVSPDHPYLATIDGALFSKPDKRLVCYPVAYSAEAYEIPQGIIAIGNYAFYDCNFLKSITIPDSVTDIGFSAFSGCKSLKSISIPKSVTSIGPNAFYEIDHLTVTVSRDSYAKEYCVKNDIKYTYPDAND